MNKPLLTSRFQRRLCLCTWLFFLFVLLMIMILSFQSGEVSKNLTQPIVKLITGEKESTYLTDKPTETELTAAFDIRQTVRILLFFALGFLAMMEVYLSFILPAMGTGAIRSDIKNTKHYIFLITLVTAFLFVVSYLTERLKEYIPGRHYEKGEYYMSFISSLAGLFVMLLCIYLLSQIRLHLRRKRGHGHTI